MPILLESFALSSSPAGRYTKVLSDALLSALQSTAQSVQPNSGGVRRQLTACIAWQICIVRGSAIARVRPGFLV